MARATPQDQLFCVATGDLKLVVVPAWERDLLYTGGKVPTNYSPVDLFRPDSRQHENFKSATPFDINLQWGDCMYLPAYWWYQFETSQDKFTSVITYKYTVSSEWVKLVFWGLE